MRTFVYPAGFEPGETPGVLVVTFRDIPEAITQGKGEKDALWQATDCLEEAVAGRIAGLREIPRASRTARGEQLIPVPAPMEAKAALYLAMREAGISNVQLARKLGCDEKKCGGCSIPGTPPNCRGSKKRSTCLERALSSALRKRPNPLAFSCRPAQPRPKSPAASTNPTLRQAP